MYFQQITNLISELLYKHDCVIVPNFGGFVARQTSASFSKGNDVLYPQVKLIIFNKNLIHNDGLLATALMEKSAINFEQATQTIADYKDYIQSLLSVKKRFELQNIGLLYTDNDNTLRFEAKTNVNFLLESFGFEPITAKELNLEPEQSSFKPVFEDRKIIIEQPIVQKRSYRKIATLAVGVPLTLALLLFAASTKPVKPLLESSVNPFYTPEKTYTPITNYNSPISILKSNEVEPLQLDNNGNASFKLSNEGNVLVATINEIAKPTLLEKSSHSAKKRVSFDGNFQVVVGCFGVEANAYKLVKDLVSNNIAAGVSGLNAKGLHVVSCGGFSTKEEATTLLTSIKNQYPNSWVMTK